jgi:hypothetical protein
MEKEVSINNFVSGERGTLTFNTDFAAGQDTNRWGDYSFLRPADDALAKGGYFLSTGSFGRHNLKLGYDSFDEVRSSSRPPTTPDFTLIRFNDPSAKPERRRRRRDQLQLVLRQ